MFLSRSPVKDNKQGSKIYLLSIYISVCLSLYIDVIYIYICDLWGKEKVQAADKVGAEKAGGIGMKTSIFKEKLSLH